MDDDPITLLLAVQNKAVDVLVQCFEPFVENSPETSEVGMLVVGSKENSRMGEYANQYTPDALLEQNPDYITAEEEFIFGMANCHTERVKKLLEKNLALARSNALSKMLRNVQIIFSTVTEVAKILTSPELSSFLGRIETVIVDEAGTLPEWQAALIAVLPAVQRLVFVGDVQQLPPFSLIRENTPEGFLERIQHQMSLGGIRVPMLTKQFRMHPDIADLVSNSFYDGRLKSDSTATKARMPEFSPGGMYLAGLYWLAYDTPTHVIEEKPTGSGYFVTQKSGVLAGDCRRADGAVDPQLWSAEQPVFRSVANATEIHHILEGLELFATSGVFKAGKTVGVISFYKQQNELLKLAVQASPHSELLLLAISQNHLRLLTVDSSQGDEADIIILSCTRSNLSNDVGFLAGKNGTKRICVALSRAREALVIVGDQTTVAGSSGRLAFSRLWRNEKGTSEAVPQMTILTSFGVLAAAANVRASKEHSMAVAAEELMKDFGLGGGNESTSGACEEEKGTGEVYNDDGDDFM
jgi:hypothetical protein